MNKKQIDYNKSSAKRLGWKTAWFCCEGFDETLIENVKDFQRQYNLEADGLVDPKTFRRIFTEIEANTELDDAPSHITCDGVEVPLRWDRFVGIEAPDALVLPRTCFKKTANFTRKPTLIVTHWDAALSATSCHKILKRRGLSSHFVIDNDGTIYQMVDTNNIAWHAKGTNESSIGIDFSNAYYLKYQKVYRKRGFGNRPVLESTVHGSPTGAHLGYYEVQLEAYKALLQSLCSHYNIPLECPQTPSGGLYKGVYDPATTGQFHGVVCHYHLNAKKIDCAGLELESLLKEIKTI